MKIYIYRCTRDDLDTVSAIRLRKTIELRVADTCVSANSLAM